MIDMEKQNKPSMAKKIGALVLTGVIGIGAGMGGMMLFAPEPVDVAALEAVAFQAGADSVVIPEPTVVTETVEVVKEVEVPVVDSFIVDSLTERGFIDSDEDITEIFMAQDAALALAVAEIESEFDKVLEDEDLVADDRDAELVKVYADWDDVTTLDSDFDNDEYEYKIKVKVEDTEEDTKFKVYFTVSVEDGEAEITDVEMA
jgi:hypothetical protein